MFGKWRDYASKARAFQSKATLRLESTQVKKLSGAPHFGRLLVFPTKIRLGWKVLPGTRTLAYYKHSLSTVVKSFITLVLGQILLEEAT
jgi:hypothetical protein